MKEDLPRRLLAMLNSMAGRIFVLLTIGMVVAAVISLALAERAQRREFERVRLERVVATVTEMKSRYDRDPQGTETFLRDDRIIGARAAPDGVAIPEPDTRLVDMLRTALGEAASPDAGQIPASLCFPRERSAVADPAEILRTPTPQTALPDCWVVRFNDVASVRHALAVYLPPIFMPDSSARDPLYLLILVGASALLAIMVARFAAAPVTRLAKAAKAFSLSLDPDTLKEQGPTEVKAALATFNLMQSRVRDGFRERTQLLASISHDLQTPLTRLRLRLEQVEDPQLKERLISDLVATQALVREGLDLARSSESGEDWSVVDLDSLVASIAEDAAEFGANVHFLGGCKRNVRVKPNALSRALNNLVDNAVKYGGGAEISCWAEKDRILVQIRDRGPGLSSEQLERVFEPFVRGQPAQVRAARGTGIGLTIARAQAHTSGAKVNLRNHPEVGLIAEIEIPL